MSAEGYVEHPVILIAGARKVQATIRITAGPPRPMVAQPFQLQINSHELDYLLKKLNG